jgi:hypothetical protein
MARRNAEAVTETIDETAQWHPGVARTLAALPLRDMSGTEVLLWWTGTNGWLSNTRPIDVVRDDPVAVEEAPVGWQLSLLSSDDRRH